MMTSSSLRRIARPKVRLIVAALLALLFAGQESGRNPIQAQGVPSPIIANENNQPGATDWDVSGAGEPTIQGFATDISVNTGETVSFKINTDSTNYTIDIYRLGYYGGA